MRFARHHLGWQRPFTLEFAERLKAEARGSRELDGWLVWVPSARTGRHVLAELFSGPEEAAEALHPPRFMTPAQFAAGLRSGAGTASEAQRLYAWKRTLMEAAPAVLQPLFPSPPATRRDAWAYGIARQFLRLRERLAEDTWDFRGVAAQPLPAEQERWNSLAALEAAYLRHLAAAGLEDPDEVYTRALAAALPLLPYTRLLVAGVLNLSRRQAACVEAMAAHGLSVDFFLPVTEDAAAGLDDWGRPCTGVWDRQPLPDDLLAGRLQRAAEPRELVDRTLELADACRDNVDVLVLGAPEPELRDYLIERSRLSTAPVYAPEGRPLAATAWGRLIRLLHELQAGAAVGTLLELLRHSLFRKWAVAAGFAPEAVERALVILQKERLVTGLDQLRDRALSPDQQVALVRQFHERVGGLLTEEPGQEDFAEWLWTVLQRVAAAAELSDELLEVLGQLEELLEDQRASFAGVRLADADHWEILQYLLETAHHYPEREAGERPVSGWLELPWETAPHLVLLGLPDAQVPGTDSSDSFITPRLCRQLGLYGPDEAAAFHAFRLRLLLECRRTWGRVDILLADRGMDDSPVLPCRFLFLASEDQILGRVRALLGDLPARESSLPTGFGAVLRLPEPPRLQTVSVTGLAAWLGSPFRFCLEHLLRWEVPQAMPREMDAAGFGSLAHAVLERLNGSDTGAGLVAEKQIQEFLEAALADELAARYGSAPCLPVRIQADSLRERLRAAAGHVAAARRAGWRPFKVEWAFHKESEFLVGGLPLHGKVDLLERNEETGMYRIIDYKTSDKSDGPERAHLLTPNAASAEPPVPECDFMLGGKRRRWKDLQLPLYQLAVSRQLGAWPLAGYFQLVKAVRDIRIEEWDPGEEVAAAALRCAEAVVARIQAGCFPLDGMSRYEDPWLEWFGGDPGATLDPGWRARHTEASA